MRRWGRTRSCVGPLACSLEIRSFPSYNGTRSAALVWQPAFLGSTSMGVKKTGKGRRKLGQKKRRMRAKIRHRK